VRLVRAAAIQRDLADRVELVLTNPFETGNGLEHDNPLGKVPALHVGEEVVSGGVLYDSRVICEYLDTLGSAAPLLALGTGMCDLTVDRFLDRSRPEDKQNSAFQERRATAIRRALDWLEEAAGHSDMADMTIGTLAVGCALGYVDLRAGDLNWRDHRPALTAWARHRESLPALAETAPPTS
jgi:glutathione S-transferase